MANAAKARGSVRAAARSADSDILPFLTRTLRAHFMESQPENVLVKLHNLKRALEQQEITLSEWPDSPNKDCICAALAKAKRVVVQILDNLDGKAAVARSER